MSDPIEFESVEFITIETLGAPGDRVFHLQTGQQNVLFTVTIEKEQASALADGIVSILDDIKAQFSLITSQPKTQPDMALREPIIPQFRVGQIGLGYDNEKDQLVLMLSELQAEDAIEEQRIVRVRLTRQQLLTLANHTKAVVAGGRAICGNCGRPMDTEGHFCPKSNGHKKEPASV